jgi:hypothetical protein
VLDQVGKSVVEGCGIAIESFAARLRGLGDEQHLVRLNRGD